MHYMAKELGESRFPEDFGWIHQFNALHSVCELGNRYRARVDLVGLVLLGEIHDH
jgi:hypothetical protein